MRSRLVNRELYSRAFQNHSADVPIEGYFHPSMVEDPWGGPKAAVEENAESSSDEVPLEDDPADE